jgi:hypothetical protein
MPKKSRKVVEEPQAVTSHGIRDAEMRAAILPLKRRPVKEVTAKSTIYYTIFGEHDDLVNMSGDMDQDGYPVYFGDDHPEKIYAKASIGPQNKYYIRLDNIGHFFNPIGLLTSSSHNKYRYIKDQKYSFVEVNPEVFRQYVMFLKTRNDAWYRQAERNMS